MNKPKTYNITFEKTEFEYLNMILNEVQNNPLIREGYGFRIFAFLLQRKINGKQLRGSPHETYKRAVQAKVRRRITLLEMRMKNARV